MVFICRSQHAFSVLRTRHAAIGRPHRLNQSVNPSDHKAAVTSAHGPRRSQIPLPAEETPVSPIAMSTSRSCRCPGP